MNINLCSNDPSKRKPIDQEKTVYKKKIPRQFYSSHKANYNQTEDNLFFIQNTSFNILYLIIMDLFLKKVLLIELFNLRETHRVRNNKFGAYVYLMTYFCFNGVNF